MKKAAIFIIFLIALIVVADVYLIVDGGVSESISFQIIEWSYNFPVFTFLVGFTMGHLFWKISDVKKEKDK
jgi:hypothetical protein